MENEKRRNNVIILGIPIDSKNEMLLKEGRQSVNIKGLYIDIQVKGAGKLTDLLP